MRFLWLIVLAAALLCAGEPDPVVAVNSGRLQGRLLTASSGAAFKGIPYAQPPISRLRWHEPMPVTPWEGIRDAGTLGAPCPQNAHGWNDAAAHAAKEDCLYLNVWTPEWPPKSKKAVMFWIHGGGNAGGSVTSIGSDGAVLASHGIVVVTIHYRLNAFGFMAHPELTAESAHHASGNYGLLDQIAALRWVHDNIAQFGGDPERVTVAGQSAGAQDLGLLMTSPLTKGLFHGAIAESGTVTIDGNLTLSLSDAERNGEKMASALQAPQKGAIEYLRSLPVDEILKVAEKTPGGPNVDRWVLPRLPVSVFAEGQAHKVALLIGNNGRERSFPRDTEALKRAIESRYGDLAAGALKLYGLAGDPAPESYPPYGDAGAQFATDSSYRCSEVAVADWFSGAGNPVYQYEFTYSSGPSGAAHSAELASVFGRLSNDSPLIARQLSEAMQRYWTNFAKTGDPNGADLPQWPRYNVGQRRYIEFSADGPIVKSNLRRPFCAIFLQTLQRKLGQ
jgi:para-nitrobenzyl esterase